MTKRKTKQTEPPSRTIHIPKGLSAEGERNWLAMLEAPTVPECGSLPVHGFDPQRGCCIYDEDSPVHDTNKLRSP